MENKQMKVISTRFEEDTLKLLDSCVNSYTCISRSDVIRSITEFALETLSREQLYKIITHDVRYYDIEDFNLQFNFKRKSLR